MRAPIASVDFRGLLYADGRRQEIALDSITLVNFSWLHAAVVATMMKADMTSGIAISELASTWCSCVCQLYSSVE